MSGANFCPRTTAMPTDSPARVALMFAGLLTVLAATTFNTMSDFGAKSGIFRQRAEDVMSKYSTPITPAPWVFFVWDYIYFWIFAMYIYFLVGLCRRSAYSWMHTTPAALPYGFHISTIVNVSLNTTWLFLFDRELLLSGFITSTLMMLTDYMILFFACHGLKIYGEWLHNHHRTDLWIFRILVQNGVALYATWGTLWTLLNLSIFLQYNSDVSSCDCSMLSLMLLLMTLLAWFFCENFWLDRHVRYIMVIHPVVILWLMGTLSHSDSPGSQVYIFVASILGLSTLMLVTRVALITWRHHKRPFYGAGGPSLSPVEIALTQSRFLL